MARAYLLDDLFAFIRHENKGLKPDQQLFSMND
jgi:hypothetical protein